jgi:hypothetical protein
MRSRHPSPPRGAAGPYVGVDVGARRLHAVSLDAGLHVTGASIVDARELDALVDWAGGATVVAIDAPDRPSTGAHADDSSVARKFRSGRCAEVALGLQHGAWVPWVTPERPGPGTWIAVGIALFSALAARSGAETVEVFPHAAFRSLADGATTLRKTTVEGARRRAALLRRAGVRAPDLELWAHDPLDALAGALVAAHRGREQAVRVACARHAEGGGDGSAIWLPAELEAPIAGPC